MDKYKESWESLVSSTAAGWSINRPIYVYEQDGVGWAEIREVLWNLVQVYRFRGSVRSGW
jgi:hypothetical protein